MVISVLLPLLMFVVGVAYAFLRFEKMGYEYSSLVILTLTMLATLYAVLVALFREQFSQLIKSTKLLFEKPERENSILDRQADKIYFHHHLRVVRKARFKPSLWGSVTGCQIFITRIESVEPTTGSSYESFTFAVPRYLNWAPSEGLNPRRDIRKEEIFDLGVTVVNDTFFQIGNPRLQSGAFDHHVRKGEKKVVYLTLVGDCGVEQLGKCTIDFSESENRKLTKLWESTGNRTSEFELPRIEVINL